MPIQFRCQSCKQKLSISRRKAGKMVSCPACAADIEVPSLESAEATGKLVPSPEEELQKSEPERPTDADHVEEDALFDKVADGVFDDLEEGEDWEDTSPQQSTPSEAGEPRTEQPEASQAATAASPPVGRVWADEEEDEEDGFHLARKPVDESGLDMTPMVDVTFLLLIFFMITASFSVQKSMEAEPPEPEQEGAAQLPSMDDLADDSVIVEIDENDAIYVDDVQVGSIGELTDVLAQKVASEQKLEMIIEPHPQAKHGTVVQVTDAGVEVGMQRIRRVTQKGE